MLPQESQAWKPAEAMISRYAGYTLPKPNPQSTNHKPQTTHHNRNSHLQIGVRVAQHLMREIGFGALNRRIPSLHIIRHLALQIHVNMQTTV